jgi:alkylated DNA repair dioxygenase AlkB
VTTLVVQDSQTALFRQHAYDNPMNEWLFPIESLVSSAPSIPGLRYLPNYVLYETERKLIAAIDAESWNTAWQRRRQLYGADYGKSEGNPQPMPDWGVELAERMYADGITPHRFDQMLVNEYVPGQGISMHRDYQTFDDTVVSLSLLSTCIMDFRYAEDGRRESLLLEPRSLLVLSGESRQGWQHGIAARKKDAWQGRKLQRGRRLSVTFRTVK